ncbi:MAG: branched-chain amino acid ABC transporter permease [Truepera sp.]|jgi:branched-chain amino acid transport system permease protein/neutral amino acid transport system permease protein|nr:branched-chain amino acid ABC transporter permease [Truepera sp.]HRN18232.1 branched-chain amino acid ABC transporter permease [Trueperaceae bacterium]HRQ10373.1 branched-chain amino acid ABC transporter permease [Trueperaceae bacterium]
MTETTKIQLRPGERFKKAIEHPATMWVALLLLGAVLFIVAEVKGVSGTQLLSLLVRGTLLGGTLALGAVGVTLVYGVLKMANFAHGDTMTLGAYLGLIVITLLPKGPVLKPFSFGYEFLVGLVIVIPLVGLVAFGLDRIAFRPLRARRSQPIMFAMAALGLAFGIRSLIYIFWGADFSFYYTGRPRPAFELFSGVRVRPDQLFILGLAIVLIVSVYLLLERTKVGKAMRAMADNPDLARVTGIDTNRVVFWTWVIGGGMAAAGGMLYGLDVQLRPEMGWWLLLPLFASVILGTIGNAYGALAGAFIIGIVWQVSTAFVNPAYGHGISFLVMVLVLLVRPEGLFGKRG